MRFLIKINFLLLFLLASGILLGAGQNGFFSNISNRTDKEYLDSLYYVADTSEIDTVKAINYLKIAVALDLCVQKKFRKKSGKDFLLLSKELAFKNGKFVRFVEALDEIGVRKRRNGHFNMALKYHLMALSMVDSISQPQLKSIILNNIGVVYRRIDDYQDALKYHIDAFRIADSLNDNRTKAMAINSIGNVYMALEKYDDALQSFKKSLSLEYDLHNKLGIAINLNNIGSAYQARGDLNKAFEYFNLSLDVNREIKSQKGIGICHNDIGNIYYHKKLYHKALSQYNISENIFLKTGDKLYLANTYLMIGQTLLRLNEFNDAEQYLLKAMDIARSIGSKVVAEKTYRWLSKTYKKSNDFQKALYYLELSNSLQDSINNIAIQKNVIRMKIKYDLESKENEIVLLHQQQRINTLELKKQKTANLLMFVGIVLILVLMVFLIFYVRVRNQKSRLLEKKNREIEQAQIELKKYSEDLLVAKQQAEKSSRAKSEFLANMSHEFRTPLNSVIGFTELLLSKETDSDKKEKLKLIQSSSKSLLVLLTDILDLSKVESGKLKIDYQPVNIVRVVDEVYQMFKINTETKGIRFEYTVQNNFPSNVILNELRLRQVLLNLIGNAVKFTESGEIHIEVNFEEVPRAARFNFCIKVKDTGKGIALTDIEKIFEPFVQLNTENEHQGTGLGLAITRRIVETMGGELAVTSEPDVGSCFTIKFKDVSKAGKAVTSDSNDQENKATDVADVKAVVFTNEPDECFTLTELLQNAVAAVSVFAGNLHAVKKILSEIDLLVLCSADDEAVANAYRVINQTENGGHLWIVVVSEQGALKELIHNPKHIVIGKNFEQQQASIKKLIFEINADKLFGRLSGCVERLKTDSDFNNTMVNEVIPIFTKASETKLMNNFLSFSNALDNLAKLYSVEAAAIFSGQLKKSIKKFDIKEIEELLNYFKTNCIDTIKK